VGARQSYQPWTDAEIEVARRNHAAGIAATVTAQQLQRPRESVKNKLQHLGLSGTFAAAVPRVPEPMPVADTASGDARVLDHPPLGRIVTLDDLLAMSRVDLSEWEVERHIINKWEVGATGPDGTLVVEPLWQVKAWLRRKASTALAEHTERLMAHISADTAHRRVAPPLRPANTLTEPHMLEVCIFDLHIGKLAWAEETGHDYDVRIADERARAALEDLLWQASLYPVSRIVLPLGNDFYQVDTISGQTTAGTLVDRDTRYHKMFEVGRGLASWMIHRCASVAPVVVPVVPGNHDTQAVYSLGQALTWEYASDPRVTIDNAPTRRKYQRWGSNLIGYTHGNEEKISDLAQIMATERAKEWGETTCREWRIGHRHRPKQMQSVSVDSKNGVRVREISSLSGDDAWHTMRGYVGEPKEAEAFVWRFRGGVRAHLTHRASVSLAPEAAA